MDTESRPVGSTWRPNANIATSNIPLVLLLFWSNEAESSRVKDLISTFDCFYSKQYAVILKSTC